MYPRDLNLIRSPEIRQRIATERKILRALVTAALEAGYQLAVDEGRSEGPDYTRNTRTILDLLQEADEDVLYLRHPETGVLGSVFLVYGNDGYDVIADHTLNITRDIQPALDLADRLAEGAGA